MTLLRGVQRGLKEEGKVRHPGSHSLPCTSSLPFSTSLLFHMQTQLQVVVENETQTQDL